MTREFRDDQQKARKIVMIVLDLWKVDLLYWLSWLE